MVAATKCELGDDGTLRRRSLTEKAGRRTTSCSAATTNGRRSFADRGAVLLVVLIVMVALLGVGMAGLFLTSGAVQVSANINLRNQALIVAEAGLERARAILNSPTSVPPVPSLLAGTGNAADEIPSDVSQCQGEARGAVLIDTLRYSSPCTQTPCPLRNIAYPSIARTTGLPPSAGIPASASLGNYTVYIRQDQADCRMGNFTCDQAGSFGIDAGVGGGSGQATCSPPAGSPKPNGAIIVRSEGEASDGRTRVVLEVTLTAAQGGQHAVNTPLSALCSAGARGCDDSSSVQNGIVVNSNVPQSPPSLAGASGTGGAGTGGAAGSGGSTTPGSGAGGSSGAGGMGAGGSGTGGSPTCGGAPCTAPKICCNGNQCLDPTSDKHNCGACGVECPGGTVCIAGSCRNPCFAYAVAAVGPCPTGCITINGGSIVDSYNRNAGPYSPWNKGTADVAMTCTQAQNGCPNNCPSGCITGSVVYGQTFAYDVNTLPAPPYSTNWNSVTVPPDTTLNSSPSSAVYYNNINLNSGTLTLTAGLYVVDSINLNAGGTLYIDDSAGPVRLWIVNSVSPNCPVTVKSGNPANFWLIYNGTGQINNNTNNDFTGIIFAPGAQINLNYNVNGAVIGSNVTLNGAAQVHFDTTLKCP